MNDISIQRMSYFITAAEYCSFSQAADKLYVSQPQISKWIRGLENDLGITLFTRTAHGVALTREGRYLYEEWKPLYQAFQNSLKEIRSMADQTRSSLNIGSAPVLNNSAHLNSALNAFESACPQTDITVEVYEFSELTKRLLDGSLDMIYTYNFHLDGIPGISTAYLHRSQVCIAIPAAHRLAHKADLKLSDLTGETLLLEQTPDTENETNWVLSECQKNGCYPGHIRYTPNITSLVTAINRNKGFSLLCQDIADTLGNSLITRSLPAGYIPVYVVLAWVESRETPEITAFSRYLNQP